MNYTEAFEKLERYGQTHVLDYYERLTEEGRKKLLDQIEAADLSVLDSIGSKSAAGTWKTIEPLQGLSLEEIAADWPAAWAPGWGVMIPNACMTSGSPGRSTSCSV